MIIMMVSRHHVKDTDDTMLDEFMPAGAKYVYSGTAQAHLIHVADTMQPIS